MVAPLRSRGRHGGAALTHEAKIAQALLLLCDEERIVGGPALALCTLSHGAGAAAGSEAVAVVDFEYFGLALSDT